MIANKAEYKYFICRDSIDIYHPKEEYTIQDILEEYRIKPTHPTILTYTKSWVKTKEEFEQFVLENNPKIRKSNNLHCEAFSTFEVLVVYSREWEIKAIAAYDKQILYLYQQSLS